MPIASRVPTAATDAAHVYDCMTVTNQILKWKGVSKTHRWRVYWCIYLCSLIRYFRSFPIISSFAFLAKLVSEDVSNQQIPSADFPRQQFRFLSADSVSRFLFSADLLFVSRFRQQISLVSSFIFSGVAGNSWNQLLNWNPHAIHPFY